MISSKTKYDYWIPEVILYNHSYPFGMQMPERYNTADGYRYGFQGQEKDNELKGEGNSLNYEYRMHDPRIGRFFAVDPLAGEYPQWTPYAFSGNQVIASKELEGLEPSVDLGVKTGVLIDIGNKGNTSFRGFVAPNFTLTGANDNWQGNFGASFSFYNGGIGTNQGATGKSSFNVDMHIAAGFTVGTISGSKTLSHMDIGYFQSGTGLSINNEYTHSFSYGIVGTFSFQSYEQRGRNQVNGYLGIKGKNLSFSTYNDILTFTDKLNNDSYITGGFELQGNLGAGSTFDNWSVRYDAFTGRKPLADENGNYPSYKSFGHSYYSVDDESFNNGKTVLRLSNELFAIGVGHTGNGWLNGQWLQNLIHDKYPGKRDENGNRTHLNRFGNHSKESIIYQFDISRIMQKY